MKTYKKEELHLYNGTVVEKINSYIAIDPEKLRTELNQKGVSMDQASIALGYSRSTLGSAAAKGYFHNAIAVGIKTQFGISPEQYAFNSEQDFDDEPKNDGLYEIIKSAVSDALKEAALPMIQQAVEKAFKNL